MTILIFARMTHWEKTRFYQCFVQRQAKPSGPTTVIQARLFYPKMVGPLTTDTMFWWLFLVRKISGAPLATKSRGTNSTEKEIILASRTLLPAGFLRMAK